MPPRRRPEDDREFHPQPVTAPTPTDSFKVGPSTVVKAELSTIVTVTIGLVTAVVWGWSLYLDVQRLKEDLREVKTDITEIRKAVAPNVAKSTLHGPPAPANP